MIRLSGRIDTVSVSSSGLLARVTNDPYTPLPLRSRLLLDCRDGSAATYPEGFAGFLVKQIHSDLDDSTPQVAIPDWADYITSGDVVYVNGTGHLNVLYRRASKSNSILVTERCSSDCLMCSQPPKSDDDSGLYEIAIRMAEHLPTDVAQIGITGGEPLLRPDLFLTLLNRLHSYCPHASIHVLSNGRLLSYLTYAQAIAKVGCRDLMIGIPLYSADPVTHDFVVQARGAFDQTVRGIINLGRCGVPVEIRVVLHQQTTQGLERLAAFIRRHLPFINHVAFMGLEHMGYVKMNAAALKQSPLEYVEALSAAVDTLASAHIPVSIYNLPLCLLPPGLRDFARQSISDWKNDFAEQCNSCALQPECPGMFTWNVSEFSSLLRPVIRE